MKKMKLLCIVIAIITVIVVIFWLIFGDKIKVLYTSLNSFRDENLAYTFQHTPEIQPTKKISKGEKIFQFKKEENITLADGFTFQETFYTTEDFIEDTKWIYFSRDILYNRRFY